MAALHPLRPPTRRRSWPVALLALAMVAVGCGGGGGGDGAAGDDDDPIEALGEPGDRAVQTVGAGKVRLFGTLSMPSAASGGRVPGVLFVPSAGRGDRNGLISETGAPDPLALDLAQSFSAAGLASYRYDRRGTGESRLAPDVRLTFDDLVADARAGLDLLAERKETAGRELAVVGYDQGGLVALRLAATDDRVRRLILISTPGRSLVDTQAAALGAQYGPESAEALRSIVATLRATRTLPPLDAMRAELRTLLPSQEAAFLADLYAIDPAAEASPVNVPTLIVVPGDAAPYDPARLAGAIDGSEVVAAPGAGPTLLITERPPSADLSDPSSPAHQHGAATPVAPTKRDVETMGRMSGFLLADVAARGPG